MLRPVEDLAGQGSDDVGLDEFEARMGFERWQVRWMRGLQIVEADHMRSAREQLGTKMRADEAGAAGNQRQRRLFHRNALTPSRSGMVACLDQIALQLCRP